MRRRRNRGTWLPTLGYGIGETDEVFLSGFPIGGTVPAAASSTFWTSVDPVTTDVPFEGDDVNTGSVMSTVIGNEYFLDRIVGKCFLQYTPALDGTGQVVGKPCIVTAGFFVARADDAFPERPIGAGDADTIRDSYNPLDLDTIREPWIWRRTWLLGTSGNARTGGGISLNAGSWEVGAFPSSTALFGSVLDGPHIDAKTKRRVGQDDRLWFALGIASAPFGEEGTVVTAGQCRGYLDYRLHGQLRRARPNGKF